MLYTLLFSLFFASVLFGSEEIECAHCKKIREENAKKTPCKYFYYEDYLKEKRENEKKPSANEGEEKVQTNDKETTK